MPTIMPIYGTRPEAIKMAPLISAMQASDELEVVVTVTGQHGDMLDQVNALFAIAPDFDLKVLSARGGLPELSARILERLSPILRRCAPDAVLVQGDTATAAIAALAAYYEQIPVIHLEAGLRSGDLRSPFPEEGNRRIISQIASLHLAPTGSARSALEREGIPASAIAVTGNTVIDAMLQVVQGEHTFSDQRIADAVASGRRIVLVTAHRRESWQVGIAATARALRRISIKYPEIVIVLPVHANAIVGDVVRAELGESAPVILTGALDYRQFIALLSHSYLVVTDSGGVQEEAPTFGIPVLVTRDTTERAEGVTSGTVRLIGTDEEEIVRAVSALLEDSSAYSAMSRAVNPYGDGHASERALAAILEFFRKGLRLPDFRATEL